MNSELELLVKLKHPNPRTDIEGFINSLPDCVVEKFYMDRDYTLEEKRWKAIEFHITHTVEHNVNESINYICKLLKKHYSGESI